MALMVLSNVSNHITKEEEVNKLRCTATRQLLKSSREALRKYLTGGDVLKKLHDLCEIIEKFNHQGIENNVNAIDVESSSFLLDVVELIIQSHGDLNAIQKLMSSRILASLLVIQRKILHNYRVSNVAVSNQSAQIWVISSR
jgi:3-methyladenine DNA glycosylase AlkC